MDEAGVSYGVKQREAAPQSVEDSNVDSNAILSMSALSFPKLPVLPGDVK